jgi:oligoribonuclease (3'-5' exoribonuclease)
MSTSIRRTLKARVLGNQITTARQWETDEGLKMKAHTWYKILQPTTLKDIDKKLRNEIRKEYAIVKMHADSERGEQNSNGKGNRIVLKDCA